jgi:hypothetical protein
VSSSGNALDIKVDADKKEGLCGICGDCDGNSNNDWTVGPNSTCASNYDDDEWPAAGSIVSHNSKTRRPI